MPQRILIVDDDVEATQTLRRFLEKNQFLVWEENDSAAALRTAQVFHPDCVILDYQMPQFHGGDVAWQLASDPSLKNTKVIVCSGVSAEEIHRKLPPARIPIMEKPVDGNELLKLLRSSGEQAP